MKSDGALPVTRQAKDDEVGQLNLIDKQKRLHEKFDLTEEVNQLQEVMPYSEIVNNLDLVKDAVNTAKYKLIFLS